MEDIIPAEEPVLLDLTKISLIELGKLNNSVLERLLRRLLKEADNPSEAIAGFQSSVSVTD